MFFKKSLALSLLILSAACTKEIPYKEEVKEKVHDKSVIAEGVDRIYVSSYGSASRTTETARPYWLGQEKIARFKFTEKTLQLLEMDADPRFSDNTENQKLILEIPIEHLQFRCAPDRYGECTNKEEQDKDTPWDKRKLFKPDFGATKVTEASLLPIEIEALFGNKCYTEVNSKFVSYELKSDILNFSIDRTFQGDAKCLDNLNSISDLTETVRYNYSIASLEPLVTPNYTVVEYPTKDEGTFGFFTTELTKLDPSNRDLVQSKKVMLNRWAPTKTNIVYYLTDNFYKPENAKLVDATQKAFDEINRGFEAAGSPVHLSLDRTQNKNPGDIRNSMIILVEDPLNMGILGYGPTTSNPRTGEIISGRVVMYSGVQKKYIKLTYNEIVEKLKAEKAGPLSSTVVPAGAVVKSKESESKVQILGKADKKTRSPLAEVTKTKAKDLDIAAIKKDVTNYISRSNQVDDLATQLEIMSKHCLYPAELFNFQGAVLQGLKDALGTESFKMWDDLSDDEKTKVIDVILPYVYVPTLVHELGHNIGLRHNFAGSEDKANFWDEKTLAERGINNPVPYSSVMDYSFSEINNLHIIGKYDIAAIRFAYLRKAELEDGSLVDIDSSLEKLTSNKEVTLKNYEYCTDEHVGANPGCKRFDEGTSLSEIASHIANRGYLESYKRANFRNQLRSFSLMDELKYLGRVKDTFRNLRLDFETSERIIHEFDLADSAEEWTSIPFLADLQKATDTAFQTYIDVLTMPDTMCAIAEAKTPDQIMAIELLSNLNAKATSCFDTDNVKLNSKYVIVAQGGKAFNSKKDPHNDNPYVDQIDVRGIWVDKLLALKYLLQRELGESLFDKNTDNFGSRARYRAPLISTLKSIVLGNVTSEVDFKSSEGRSEIIKIGYDFNDLIIRKPLDSKVGEVLGLEAKEIPFRLQVLRMIKKEVPKITAVQESREFVDHFKVLTNLPFGAKLSDFEVIKIGSDRYFAGDENTVAKEAIQSLKASEIYSKLDDATIEILANTLNKNEKLPENASADLKAAFKLGKDTLVKYLRGEIKSVDFYSQLLALLADT